MKTYIVLLMLAFAIGACTQTGTIKLNGDSTRVEQDSSLVAGSETLCFERYSGSRNQDTASVKLVLDGTRVTGSYANLPFEKDARIGTISGTRSGNIIKGMWRFQQEGMTDSIAFEFKIDDDRLLQKPTSFDPTSGREALSDTSGYSLEYKRLDCDTSNLRIR